MRVALGFLLLLVRARPMFVPAIGEVVVEVTDGSYSYDALPDVHSILRRSEALLEEVALTDGEGEDIESLKRAVEILWYSVSELQRLFHGLACAILAILFLLTTMLTFQCLKLRRSQSTPTTALVEPIRIEGMIVQDVKKTGQA